MLRKLRKHSKWFMAGFGVLLMLAWLQGPTTNAISKMGDREVAKIDGRKVRQTDVQLATRELAGLTEASPNLVRNIFGIDQRETAHWMLLVQEATDAGLVGEVEDGRKFMDELAVLGVQQDGRLLSALMNSSKPPQTRQDAILMAGAIIQNWLHQGFSQGTHSATEEELAHTLAKARGVVRLISAYGAAPRVSDRRTIAEAKKNDDAAVVDYTFLSAEPLIPLIADPDAGALQAHFERFKATKPGEGDFGIGYLLPQRIKLEWMTLDRKAIEAVVSPDPIEVRKRYNQRHPGQVTVIPAEIAQIENEMKGEQALKVMQEAQVVIQAELNKTIRPLEREGKYRKLPADWESLRPQWSAIAKAVQEQVSHTVGFQIPLPAVIVKTGAWTDQSELFDLPGIGRSTVRQGSMEVPFAAAAFWAKEFKPAETPLAVQVGVPVYENYLSDGAGNRYFFTVLATREESAPDSVEEIKNKAVHDFKILQAFDRLKARADELKAAAIPGGIDAVAALFAATPVGTGKAVEKPAIKIAAKVRRTGSEITEFGRDESLRTAVMDAAEKFDPKSPPDQYPPEQATLILPSTKNLGLAALKIRAFVPVTREDYVKIDAAADRMVRQGESKTDAVKETFSLDALLRRHEYISNDQRVRTSQDLHKSDKDQEGKS